jgi:hypothetical protein
MRTVRRDARALKEEALRLMLLLTASHALHRALQIIVALFSLVGLIVPTDRDNDGDASSIVLLFEDVAAWFQAPWSSCVCLC